MKKHAAVNDWTLRNPDDLIAFTNFLRKLTEDRCDFSVFYMSDTHVRVLVFEEGK